MPTLHYSEHATIALYYSVNSDVYWRNTSWVRLRMYACITETHNRALPQIQLNSQLRISQTYIPNEYPKLHAIIQKGIHTLKCKIFFLSLTVCYLQSHYTFTCALNSPSTRWHSLSHTVLASNTKHLNPLTPLQHGKWYCRGSLAT